jgi:hypothetical protein
MSRASASQSTRTSTTVKVCPEVSPLRQSAWRRRDQKCTCPLSSVRATAVDGMQYGFRVMVPRECVGDRRPEPHEANLFDINSKYGDVVSKQEVLDYLAGLP